MDDFRERIERGETILFSEILKHIPSDEVLAHLFPDPYSQGQPAITHFGLEVLELRLQGLKQVQIAEKLQTTKSRVAYWSQMTMNSLHKDCLDYVEVDIPALRRLLNLERLPEGRYTKLSELLRDMPSDEELERLLPVLERLAGRLSIPISVDTYYPQVAQAALERGAAIINDVSGSLENGMPALAARCGAGLVMMHAGGGADDRAEVDAVAVVRRYFQQALEAADRAGLPLSCVCLDPGVGFGKSGGGDLRLAARLTETTAGLPEVAVLVGASRKRAIGACCGNPPHADRLAGTLAFHTAAQLQGARILRVHDVKEAVQAARVTDAILREARQG